MSDLTAERATALRKPFPKESIGQLPKGGQMLDYVGHAAVTDRLLAVDPHWSWEPMAVDQFGNPVPDQAGNLWIRLTVCGVTRIGVGDGKSMKERIGDAIRNAAMRFGVALDLWAKENLVEFAMAARTAERRQAEPPPEPPPAPQTGELMKPKTRARLFALLGEHHIADRDEQLRGITHIIGRPLESRSDLLDSEAQQVIDVLAKRPRPVKEEA